MQQRKPKVLDVLLFKKGKPFTKDELAAAIKAELDRTPFNIDALLSLINSSIKANPSLSAKEILSLFVKNNKVYFNFLKRNFGSEFSKYWARIILALNVAITFTSKSVSEKQDSVLCRVALVATHELSANKEDKYAELATKILEVENHEWMEVAIMFGYLDFIRYMYDHGHVSEATAWNFPGMFQGTSPHVIATYYHEIDIFKYFLERDSSIHPLNLIHQENSPQDFDLFDLAMLNPSEKAMCKFVGQRWHLTREQVLKNKPRGNKQAALGECFPRDNNFWPFRLWFSYLQEGADLLSTLEKALLENNKKDYLAAIMNIVKNGSARTIKDAFLLAAECGHFDAIKFIIISDRGNRKLLDASYEVLNQDRYQLTKEQDNELVNLLRNTPQLIEGKVHSKTPDPLVKSSGMLESLHAYAAWGKFEWIEEDFEQEPKTQEYILSEEESGNFFGSSPYYIAVRNGHLNIVQSFSKKLTPAQCNQPLTMGMQCGLTPIFIAAAYGRTPVMEFLINDVGVPCDEPLTFGYLRGVTPLFVAAARGHIETMRLLIRKGARVNLEAGAGNFEGMTPLLMAVLCGQQSSVEELLKQQADVNYEMTAGDYVGMTAACAAASRGQTEMVAELVKHGNAVLYKEGATNAELVPLFAAAKAGRFKTAEKIIDLGGDPHGLVVRESNSFLRLEDAEQAPSFAVECIELRKKFIGITSSGIDLEEVASELVNAICEMPALTFKDISCLLATDGLEILWKFNEESFSETGFIDEWHLFIDKLYKAIKDNNRYLAGDEEWVLMAKLAPISMVRDVVQPSKEELEKTSRSALEHRVAAATVFDQWHVIEAIYETESFQQQPQATSIMPFHLIAAYVGSVEVLDFLSKKYQIDPLAIYEKPGRYQGCDLIDMALFENKHVMLQFIIKHWSLDGKKMPLVKRRQPLLLHSLDIDPVQQEENFYYINPMELLSFASYESFLSKAHEIVCHKNTTSNTIYKIIKNWLRLANVDRFMRLHSFLAIYFHRARLAITLSIKDLLYLFLAEKSQMRDSDFQDLISVIQCNINNPLDLFFCDLARGNVGAGEIILRFEGARDAEVKGIAPYRARYDGDLQTCLQIAARGGYFQMVQPLVAQGASFKVPETTGICIGESPFYGAVTNGHAKFLKKVLENKNDTVDISGPAVSGKTAIFQSARKDHGEVIEVLVRFGANPDAVIEDGECKNLTPLLAAARKGALRAVRVLVNFGVDLNFCCDSGDGFSLSPLCYAIGKGYTDVADFLIESGASLYQRGSSVRGTFAAYVAATRGKYELFSRLVNKNGDPDNLLRRGSALGDEIFQLYSDRLIDDPSDKKANLFRLYLVGVEDPSKKEADCMEALGGNGGKPTKKKNRKTMSDLIAEDPSALEKLKHKTIETPRYTPKDIVVNFVNELSRKSGLVCVDKNEEVVLSLGSDVKKSELLNFIKDKFKAQMGSKKKIKSIVINNNEIIFKCAPSHLNNTAAFLDNNKFKNTLLAEVDEFNAKNKQQEKTGDKEELPVVGEESSEETELFELLVNGELNSIAKELLSSIMKDISDAEYRKKFIPDFAKQLRKIGCVKLTCENDERWVLEFKDTDGLVFPEEFIKDEILSRLNKNRNDGGFIWDEKDKAIICSLSILADMGSELLKDRVSSIEKAAAPYKSEAFAEQLRKLGCAKLICESNERWILEFKDADGLIFPEEFIVSEILNRLNKDRNSNGFVWDDNSKSIICSLSLLEDIGLQQLKGLVQEIEAIILLRKATKQESDDYSSKDHSDESASSDEADNNEKMIRQLENVIVSEEMAKKFFAKLIGISSIKELDRISLLPLGRKHRKQVDEKGKDDEKKKLRDRNDNKFRIGFMSQYNWLMDLFGTRVGLRTLFDSIVRSYRLVNGAKEEDVRLYETEKDGEKYVTLLITNRFYAIVMVGGAPYLELFLQAVSCLVTKSDSDQIEVNAPVSSPKDENTTEVTLKSVKRIDRKFNPKLFSFNQILHSLYTLAPLSVSGYSYQLDYHLSILKELFAGASKATGIVMRAYALHFMQLFSILDRVSNSLNLKDASDFCYLLRGFPKHAPTTDVVSLYGETVEMAKVLMNLGHVRTNKDALMLPDKKQRRHLNAANFYLNAELQKVYVISDTGQLTCKAFQFNELERLVDQEVTFARAIIADLQKPHAEITLKQQTILQSALFFTISRLYALCVDVLQDKKDSRMSFARAQPGSINQAATKFHQPVGQSLLRKAESYVELFQTFYRKLSHFKLSMSQDYGQEYSALMLELCYLAMDRFTQCAESGVASRVKTASGKRVD